MPSVKNGKFPTKGHNKADEEPVLQNHPTGEEQR